MSGDCINQPVIFYSEEMTEAKISLLLHHGVEFRNGNYYFKEEEEE